MNPFTGVNSGDSQSPWSWRALGDRRKKREGVQWPRYQGGDGYGKPLTKVRKVWVPGEKEWQKTGLEVAHYKEAVP